MQHDDKKALALIRLEHAEQCLKTAKAILGLEDYKSAANRSYYSHLARANHSQAEGAPLCPVCGKQMRKVVAKKKSRLAYVVC